MPNIFILSSGRTASTTFTKACSYIKNFTSAHESRTGFSSQSRVDYPENHIEIDNRLTWFLSQLESNYKDDAYYVHLTRDKKAIAKSYLERWHLKESIVKAYGHGVLMKPNIPVKDRFDICLDYVDYVEDTITNFLHGKSKIMTIDVSELKDKFPEFYNWIGAEGDLNSCCNEFDHYSNKNKTNVIKKTIRNIINIVK
jgi:hypothetical protein